MNFFDDHDDKPTQLRDTLGNYIGEVTRVSGGHLQAKDRLGNILGEYDEHGDRTTDRLGNTIGYGDWLPGLFDRRR